MSQGSNLGLLLFILYINDYEDAIVDASVADDVSEFITSSNSDTLRQTSVKPIGIVKNDCNSIFVRINGTSMMHSDWVKFFGLELDSSLTWSVHVESLLGRLSAKHMVSLWYSLPFVRK